MGVFADAYADAYDALYAEKDYAAECDLIEAQLAAGGVEGPARIVDLGCGTGNHALPLAARGHTVVGVDRSAAMLARARAKDGSESVRFAQGDLTTLRLDETFDAALMMFAVLGYQHTNADLRAALETARAHVRPGGLLLFDVWYGPAVLRERPGTRTRELALEGGGRLERTSRGELDVRQQLVRVTFEVRSEREGQVSETEETHVMRFFFPLELELALHAAGFELLRLSAFPDVEREPDESTWNVLAVARAV